MSTSLGASSGSSATAVAPRVAAVARVAVAAAIAIGAAGDVAAAPRQAGGFTAWVYATSLEWRAQPGQRVAGELRDGPAVVAEGSTVANAVGDYTLRFQPAGQGMDGVFRPGRVLVIRLDGGDAVTETVPALHVDVASDRLHVEGRVPPGASVGLEGVREGRLQRIGETFVSPEDGRIRIPVDGLDPERSGFVHATLPSGHTFSAPFVAFILDVEVGGHSIVGRASAGTSIEGVVELASSGATHRIAPREVLAGRSWREDLPATGALDAGSVITLTRTSPAHAAPIEMALRVPRLRVAATPTEVYGEGPPDTELRLELRAPGQEATTHVVRTDAAGRYRLAVDAEQPIGAGWHIRAVLDVEPGVRYWASVPFFPIEVGLYTGSVTGVVDVSGAVVRGVLRDADGSVRAFSQATTKAQSDRVFPAGYFNLTFVGKLFQPGDAIELDWRNGDPVLLNVPAFTARVDHAADVVSGEAPPGSRVEVATYADGGSRPGVLVNLTTLDVDVDGRYAHNFRTSARYDVHPRETGHAAVVTSQGYRFTTQWRSLVLAWGAGASTGGLSGSGLPDRTLRVELFAPSGERIGRYEETLSMHGWTADVKDDAGQSVRAQAGDRFEVSMGDQTASLVVPELFGIAHVADDLITGRTQPKTRVLITIVNLDSGRYHEATMSNDTGVFFHEFGSLFDMRHNAGVTMQVDLPGGHTATSRIYSPGARVDLDAGIVTGAHEPGIDVEGIVERGGLRVAGGMARAALNGDYVLNLVAERGLNLSLIAGDVLRILAPIAEFAPEFSVRVPTFTMAIDAEARAVHGHAEPGGWLSLLARPVFSRQIKIGYDVTDASTDALIDSDGMYRIAFPDATKGALRPGQLFEGRYVLPDGHIVSRRRVVPIANVQLGGDQVCGFGVPGDAVTVTLREDRTTIATAAGTIGGDSRFVFELRGQDGEPLQTLAGQSVDVAIGNHDIAMDLPKLTIDTRWQVPFEGHGSQRGDTSLTHSDEPWAKEARFASRGAGRGGKNRSVLRAQAAVA